MRKSIPILDDSDHLFGSAGNICMSKKLTRVPKVRIIRLECKLPPFILGRSVWIMGQKVRIWGIEDRGGKRRDPWLWTWPKWGPESSKKFRSPFLACSLLFKRLLTYIQEHPPTQAWKNEETLVLDPNSWTCFVSRFAVWIIILTTTNFAFRKRVFKTDRTNIQSLGFGVVSDQTGKWRTSPFWDEERKEKKPPKKSGKWETCHIFEVDNPSATGKTTGVKINVLIANFLLAVPSNEKLGARKLHVPLHNTQPVEITYNPHSILSLMRFSNAS